MNDDRRAVRRALEHDEPTRWAPALDALLEAVADHDLRQLAPVEAGLQAPADCPSLTRHRRGALRHDWAAEELLHVETCLLCRRTQETVASALWHPEVGMLAGRLSRRLGDDDESSLERHLTDDGCQSCRRLLTSPWLLALACRMRRREPGFAAQDDVPARFAIGFAELPRAVGEFATGTRPPFQLRAVASRGDLVVTLRETDQGQLVVHVEAPHYDGEGQTVRVELLGDGDPVVADVELRPVAGEPGCFGRHAFGPFADLVPQLRPAVALLAVLAQEGSS